MGQDLEDKAVELLAKGTADAAQLARSLKVTEASALYLLHRLATSGKVTLVAKLKRP
jgi:Mn-dependent DtxR family transcriptional regulator